MSWAAHVLTTSALATAAALLLTAAGLRLARPWGRRRTRGPRAATARNSAAGHPKQGGRGTAPGPLGRYAGGGPNEKGLP